MDNRCTHCGWSASRQALHCPKCGTRLLAERNEPAEPARSFFRFDGYASLVGMLSFFLPIVGLPLAIVLLCIDKTRYYGKVALLLSAIGWGLGFMIYTAVNSR